ncbi:MAG TPA: hypothetical protein VFH97_09675 [Gemmatimonadales bacterium]|nr:hypothetical protein [Gemmatimonadales bacterium]
MTTAPKVLPPVRVPELGPALGKVLTGTGRAAGLLRLDRFRLHLVSRLFEASGESRRLADLGERDGAVAALDGPVWLDAWEQTTDAIAGALVERVNQRLAAEARAVRMPRRLRRRMALDPGEVRGVSSRLGAAGAVLVSALDDLHARAARLRGPGRGEPAALDEWQDALLAAARRTEAGWITLEEAIDTEIARWDAVAATVARWRRPWWPVLAVGAPALAAALWLGLVLGGYLTAPAWLQAVWGWVQ